jgi:hypothetical protein
MQQYKIYFNHDKQNYYRLIWQVISNSIIVIESLKMTETAIARVINSTAISHTVESTALDKYIKNVCAMGKRTAVVTRPQELERKQQTGISAL